MQAASDIVAAPPTEWGKGLRCCVSCHLVKTFEQFYEQGCENCSFLALEGDRERIYDATTTEYHVSKRDCEAAGRACGIRLRTRVLLFVFLGTGFGD